MVKAKTDLRKPKTLVDTDTKLDEIAKAKTPNPSWTNRQSNWRVGKKYAQLFLIYFLVRRPVQWTALPILTVSESND